MCDVSPLPKTIASGVTPRSFRQNAMFNLAGGGLMALYAILLPWVLSRALDPATYSAYILGVQVIPFLLILATPIQVSLAPKFAQLFAAGATAEAAGLVRVATVLFTVAAVLAAAVAVLLSLLLPTLLGWSAAFAGVASKSMLVLGIAAAFAFPALVVTSYSAGHRNFLWDNLLKCLGPYLGLVLVAGALILASRNAQPVAVEMIIGLSAAATLLAAAVVVGFGIRWLPLRVGVNVKVWSATSKALGDNVGGVLWWQICSILSVGTGVFFVSNVAPTSVAAFAVSGSLMTVIAGVSSALAGPFSVKMGGQIVSGAADRRALFQRFQRPFLIFLFGSTIAVLSIPQSVLALWVGERLGGEIHHLLLPLAIGNCFRQITAPYTTVVLGLSMQRRIWLSPAVEVLTSVTLSFVLGQFFGAIGVAYGVLAGALVRLGLTVFHDLRLTQSVLPLTMVDLLLPWRLTRT